MISQQTFVYAFLPFFYIHIFHFIVIYIIAIVHYKTKEIFIPEKKYFSPPFFKSAIDITHFLGFILVSQFMKMGFSNLPFGRSLLLVL